VRQDLEFRFVTELRSTGRVLHGLAAPYGQRAAIGAAFYETITPGAFTATLARDDVMAFVNHNPAVLLGRTKSKTLRLSETRGGLRYELDLPKTTAGLDLAELAARGDLSGVSIGFIATEEHWPDGRTRELRAVTLHEISILTGETPAYDKTTIALRHRAAYFGGAIPAGVRRRMLDLA
jgi:HK97 family phage prohead protease